MPLSSSFALRAPARLFSCTLMPGSCRQYTTTPLYFLNAPRYVRGKRLFSRSHNILLHIAGHNRVVRELDVRDAAAFGERAELRGKSEQFRKRNFGGHERSTSPRLILSARSTDSIVIDFNTPIFLTILLSSIVRIWFRSTTDASIKPPSGGHMRTSVG